MLTNADLEFFDNLVANILEKEANFLDAHLRYVERTGDPLGLPGHLPDLPGHLSYNDWINYLKTEADKFRRTSRES